MKDPKQTEAYQKYLSFIEAADRVDEECRKLKAICRLFVKDDDPIINDYEWSRAESAMNELLYYLVSKQNVVMLSALEEVKI